MYHPYELFIMFLYNVGKREHVEIKKEMFKNWPLWNPWKNLSFSRFEVRGKPQRTGPGRPGENIRINSIKARRMINCIWIIFIYLNHSNDLNTFWHWAVNTCAVLLAKWEITRLSIFQIDSLTQAVFPSDVLVFMMCTIWRKHRVSLDSTKPFKSVLVRL